MSTILQKQIGNIIPGGIPLLTTETLGPYTGRCEANLPTVRAIVRAWALIQSGTGTTGQALKLRRGNSLTGPLVFGGVTVTMAAGSTLDSWLVFAESLQNVEYVDYCLTIAPTGASANGVIVAATIEVELING
jgi:hypothetical protein